MSESAKPLYVTWDGDGESKRWLCIGPEEDDDCDAIAFSQEYPEPWPIPDDVADAFYRFAASDDLLQACYAALVLIRKSQFAGGDVEKQIAAAIAKAEPPATEGTS